MKLFVYGTLMKGYPNHVALNRGNTEYLGKAVTENEYAMYLFANIPAVTKEPNRTQIKGELYEVNDYVLNICDSIEGHPYIYRRELTDVLTAEGESVQAYIYFFTAPSRFEGRDYVRSGDYAARIKPLSFKEEQWLR